MCFTECYQSVQKIILIGLQSLYDSQNPENITQKYLFVCSAILEILEIEVSIILRVLEIRAAGGGGWRAAPGVVLC